MSHSGGKSDAERQAEQNAQRQSELNMDLLELGISGKGYQQNLIMEQLAQSFGLAPEFVRQAGESMKSAMGEQYRYATAQNEQALSQRMRQSGMDYSTNPAAMASIFGDMRTQAAMAHSSQLANLDWNVSQLGNRNTMQMLGMLGAEGIQAAGTANAGIGTGSNTLMQVAQLEQQRQQSEMGFGDWLLTAGLGAASMWNPFGGGG